MAGVQLLLCFIVLLRGADSIQLTSERVDVTAARLNLLEAALVNMQSQLSDTKTQLSDTKKQLSDTKRQLSDTQAQLSSRLDHTETQLSSTQWRLTQAEGELASTKTQLSQRIGSLENRASMTVSFHAEHLAQIIIYAGSPIIVSEVVTNVGNGYNSDTGIFTAPISGVYFAVGAAGPFNFEKWAGMYLVADGQSIAFAYAYGQGGPMQTTVHGVVHLTAGQTLWMRASTDAYYWYDVTTFSGFLITPDP